MPQREYIDLAIAHGTADADSDRHLGRRQIVDIDGTEVARWAIANQGSQQIRQSNVLSGFSLDVLETALQRSRQSDQTAVGTWLMTQFQA